jgi:hypothetical protein
MLMYRPLISLILCFSLFTVLTTANLWDNIWSNNIVDRIVFPRQFEFKISWNASLGSPRPQLSETTNYLLAHVQVDGQSNRFKVQTNFSTLSLKPQELLTVLIDLGRFEIVLGKSKESCKNYKLVVKNNNGQINEEGGVNIADIFDLWPYIMYFNQTKNEQATNGLLEFMYSYPLGEKKANDSEFFMYFDK